MYLKGFEYCNNAKEALNRNNPSSAERALNSYLDTKSRAAEIDPKILNSNRRGMDSYLKSCDRVASDLKMALNQPRLNQAFTACQATRNALKNSEIDLASEHFQRFIALKDEALEYAPNLSEQFTTRSQIKQCERLLKKITHSQKQQNDLTLAIETTMEASLYYNSNCQQELSTFKKFDYSKASISQDKRSLDRTNNNKTAALTDTSTMKYLREIPDQTLNSSYISNLQKGDDCITTLSNAIIKKQDDLNAMQNALEADTETLKQAQNRCNKAILAVGKNKGRAQHLKAKDQHQQALEALNSINASLNKNPFYKNHADKGSVIEAKHTIASLGLCLEKAQRHLQENAGSAISTASINADIPSKLATTKKDSIASSLTGTIKLLGTPPEFALVYIEDGTKPQKNIDITLDDSGFDKSLYTMGNNGTVKTINRSVSTQTLRASTGQTGYEQNLKKLNPGQSRETKVSWPENTIATLESDSDSVSPAYMANIRSNNHSVFRFDYGSNNLKFIIYNPTQSYTAHLLMPGYDSVKIELDKSGIKSTPIISNGNYQGSVLLKGE